MKTSETSNVASFRCAARAAALEAKVREQVLLALGCGKARLHVRKAKLLAAADGPQRADHEAAWMVKEEEWATVEAGRSSPQGSG